MTARKTTARRPRAARQNGRPTREDGIPATLDQLRVPIDTLKPYRRNPRRGDIGAIAASLQHHGQYRPVVVRTKTSEVLAGNHTLLAARQLGWTEIAATFVDVDAKAAAKIVLIDNRASDLAGYDDQALAELLTGLDDLAGTGYDAEAITALLQELGAAGRKDGLTDPDEIPEAAGPGEQNTRQIWQLGDHRLICGDATIGSTISELLDGRQADLLLTDPPYGVDYSEKANAVHGATVPHRDIARDTASGLGAFLRDVFSATAQHLPAGAPFYCFHADTNRGLFDAALQASGLEPHQTLIWVKQHFVIGRNDYQYQHEPIIYGWRPGAAHRWFGGFTNPTTLELEHRDPSAMTKAELVELVTALQDTDTTVIRADRPSRSALHPTTKPVALLEQLVENSARYGDAILDPFGGSGSTLIAAERTGRHAYLAEIDAAYCDVIIRRWEQHTGKTASTNGRP